jgi:hypothetical protein
MYDDEAEDCSRQPVLFFDKGNITGRGAAGDVDDKRRFAMGARSLRLAGPVMIGSCISTIDGCKFLTS